MGKVSTWGVGLAVLLLLPACAHRVDRRAEPVAEVPYRIGYADVLDVAVWRDPDLSRTLPVGLSITSGINAIAHAAEGLYAFDANPIMSLMAEEGIAALGRALPGIRRDAQDMDARSDALYGGTGSDYLDGGDDDTYDYLTGGWTGNGDGSADTFWVENGIDYWDGYNTGEGDRWYYH